MKHWAATLIALLCFFALSAQQRHVTPIDSSEDLRPVTKEELEQLREQNRLRSMRLDSLTIDSLRRDSIEKAAKKTNHPTLYAGNIITYYESLNYMRGVTFSLTYRFNAARNKYRGTGAGTDARNRM